jgi:2-oxo-4-hydroxy-4-carboxy-5-ureidoimidazoline decarboxylase
LDTHDFIAKFGGIYEHSPWVAECAAPIAAELSDMDRLAEIMADCVDNADTEKQITLIRAHPDLAGKAQIAGELTAESTEEQASAGLHTCTKLEYERFQALNDSYKEKFSFPFVMAVRGSSCEEILDTFSKRLRNDSNVEFETALAEIHKIARLRLRAMAAQK